MCHGMRWGWFQSHPTDPVRLSKNGKLAASGKFARAFPIPEDEGHPIIKASRVAGFWLYDSDRRRFRDEPSNYDGWRRRLRRLKAWSTAAAVRDSQACGDSAVSWTAVLASSLPGARFL